MADILEFRRPEGARSSRVPRRTRREPAKVIIFPGVRIERQEFSLADRVGTGSVQPAQPRYLAVED